eukprot:Gb_02080 [translate_table: standard]
MLVVSWGPSLRARVMACQTWALSAWNDDMDRSLVSRLAWSFSFNIISLVK